MKCQQVINNRLTVHYQLIDRLQQADGIGLHSLHSKAHFTDKKTKESVCFVIVFEAAAPHMHTVDSEAPQRSALHKFK